MKKLVLIDSNALVHRAFHALPPMNSSKGVMTNAVYGFTSILIKMLKDLEPDYVAATFDMAAPTFRHEEFAEYKIHRVRAPDELYAQIPIVKEILTAFGIPIYEKAGYEADDLIGALAEKIRAGNGLKTYIVTGDLDTLQLVEDDKVVVFTLRKGVTDTFIYNEEEVEKRYGLKPEQLVDYRGLKGDPSDNIPGVPGIGEKTATMLIKRFGNLERLYEDIVKIKNKKSKIKNKEISEKLIQKLLENKDQAFFSKKLSTIVRDIEVDFDLEKADWRKNFDGEELDKILKEYGFYSLVKRIPEIIDNKNEAGAQSEIAQLDLYKNEPGETKTKAEKIDKKNIEKFLTSLKSQTFSLILSENSLYFAKDEQKNFVIPFDSAVKDKNLKKPLAELMADEKSPKIVHDLKLTTKEFLKRGIHVLGTVFDTKLAAYLLNSDIKDYGLPKIYFAELGKNLSQDPADYVSALFPLMKSLGAKLKEKNLVNVLEKIEIPLSPVLAEMELSGVKIDLDCIQDLNSDISKETSRLEKKIYKMAGSEFNINSPQQLSNVLFEKLQLKGRVRKTGKGSLSTAASELDKLIDEHPIIEQIIRYRELQKLKTTYVEPFPGLVDKKTERLYTTFNQTGTTTGRLSSQEPNLQNIPIRTEMGQKFRRAFVADRGFKLLSFDYSQLELRVVAHISKDRKMIETFRRGEDIHTRTAAEIFEVPPEKVTSNMRRESKTLNFGVLYGMGQMGFQRASGVSREKAKEFISKYMEEFSGVAKYVSETKIRAHEKGFVSTIFGRRRQLPEIYSTMPELIRQAERMAINMPVQGTAADLIKLAMDKISQFLHANYKDEDAQMLLQVHDELLFEVKDELIEKITPKIKEIMENIYKMDVPLTVDAKYGDNWAEMGKIH